VTAAFKRLASSVALALAILTSSGCPGLVSKADLKAEITGTIAANVSATVGEGWGLFMVISSLTYNYDNLGYIVCVGV